MKEKIKMIEFTPIEQNGQRVLTTAQLAEAYGTDSKIILRNFTRNKDHYMAGKHFYHLTGDELKAFKTSRQIDDQFKQVPSLYLWTERGALLHAKSLNTDKAWEVYDFLLDTYFRVKVINKSYAELLELLHNEIKSDMENVVATAVENAVSETVKVLAPYIQISETPEYTQNRISCHHRNFQNGKIASLPHGIRCQVDEMIISKKYSCQKIADFITANTGISLSYMTVNRYIKKYFKN